MIGPRNSATDDDLTFSRRGVLETIGAVGAIGAFGSERATAKEQNDLIVGMAPGKARIAEEGAKSVKRTLDFGPEIGQAVVGKWPEQAVEGLKRNPHFRYVEQDTEGKRLQQSLPWGVDRVDAEIAHDNGDAGNGIDVGIIDSGIDSDHADLEDNLGDGFALTAACGTCDEEWDDVDGHGTSVAGVVGAVDNTTDVVGVAHQVTLHALKDGDAAPQASATAAALEKAADEGYDVVNISSSLSESQTLNDAIDYAVSNDVVIVASAGNAGPCSDCVSFPAKDSDVIAVSATNDTDGFASFSSEGPEVDLTAPGRSVPTTSLGGGTASVNGTSFSAPHVTAAAALLRADGVSPSNVRTELKNNAEDIGLSSDRQGDGLLDVATALDYGSANDLLEVETEPATAADFTEATLNGNLIQVTTGLESATVGFEWGEQGTALPNTTTAGARSTPGTFDATLTGLEEDTTYEFRAFATVTDDPSDVSTEAGAVRTFSTVDNLNPIADITHSPLEPNPGQTVVFDGSGSDPGDMSGDSISKYEWDLDDDGSFDDATGVTASRSYPTGGNKTVSLRVTDDFDQTATATETFYVNKAPTATFSISPDPVVRDEPATFDASGSSDPDGTVDLYEWDWDYDGSTFTVDDSTNSATTDHTFTTGGEHRVALRVTDDDGATSDLVTMTFTVHIRVAIDIKPNGGGPNLINLGSRGNAPVAVLHTSAFDPPAELDPSSVHFGDPDDVGLDASDQPEGGATPAHPGGHVEDVDRDGDNDSVFHFPIQDADFESDDTEGELVGLTNDGVPVFGTDAVKTVGRGG
jgi:subtilisin